MAHPLVRAVLKMHADPVKAPHMQAYMKSNVPFRGVSSPTQRQLWPDLFAAHPIRISTDPREVRRYVNANRVRLNPFSLREALKNV